MKKAYQRPEIEMISLIAPEKIATEGDDLIDGDNGLESSDW